MVDWSYTASVWTSWATAIWVIVGAITVWFAFLTYRRQWRSEADAHVHHLIRELMHVNMDPSVRPALEVETFSLYVLEEMVDWVREQQRDQAR